jgi:hypothetical protein
VPTDIDSDIDMTILDLPTELIADICSHLTDAQLFATRRSNKTLEDASFDHFGKRFFRKKGFMITTASLHVFKQISRHRGLQKHVQHVWFNPDCYTFARPACAPQDDDDDDVDTADVTTTSTSKRSATASRAFDKRTAQYDSYQQVMHDHAELLHTSKLEAELATAFQSLPHLRTVGMRRSEDYGPYGWTVLRDAIGEDPRVLGPIPSGPLHDLSDSTYLFIAIMSAAAQTGVKLERLYTDAIEIDNIREERLPQITLQTACTSILYLELNAVKGWLNIRPHLKSQPYHTLRRPEDFGAGLTRLLNATTNLKELGLQIFPDRKQSHMLAPTARNPDSWRLSYPYVVLQKLSSPSLLALPHLTRVKLEKVTTTSANLINFLTPSAVNLTSLKVRDVRLLASTPTSPTNPSIFVGSSHDTSEPRPWRPFFSFLLSSCPSLAYMLLNHLMHDRGTVSFIEHVSSPPTPLAPAEDADLLMNHLPPSHGGQRSFASYAHVNLQVEGIHLVHAALEKVVEGGHWYHAPLFSYLMDDHVWHTDTSDEEW